tara:strand:- start:116 stop:400 length:285 start_codon:yes stop_codon:yes gene_type:complete
MDLKKAEKHVKALKKIFPDSFISTTDDFYNVDPKDSKVVGLWTGFLEDGTMDEWGHDNSGTGYYVDPKLQKYLKKHSLYWEPYDSGTLMIYEDL